VTSSVVLFLFCIAHKKQYFCFVKIRVLIADDHPLYLDGLNVLLNQSNQIDVLTTAETGEAAIRMAQENDADVMLLDVHLPDMTGVEVLEEIRKTKPDLKVIMLTHQKGSRYLNRLEKLVISGYILKNVTTEFLTNAIIGVSSGGTCFSEDIKTISLEEDFYIKSSVIIADNSKKILTEREKEVLILVCKEYSSAEIGKKLFLSTSTIDTHRKNILQKLGLTNTVGLVKYALQNHLL
jgi:two-component system, NarL family, response regulator NreC